MKIDVALGTRSYPIHIAPGLLASAAPLLGPFAPRGRLVVVTDDHVAPLHLPALTGTLAGAGLAVDEVILPAGEATKSWAALEHLTERLLQLGVERGDAIIALGGGVIGDLVGFAASILRRGCRFIQIPTTLLAQVDSSVGGKTAINTAAGKNLVGSFHQPAMVLIDPGVLHTLPPRELRAGYAEVVKYGLINDPAFFAWCEQNGEALLAGDAAALTHAIATSCAAKAAIVAADERETADLRALLNLGHTFGHAFEAAANFSDIILHGEAVALGMALAHRFSTAQGLCPHDHTTRVITHLHSMGLPTNPATLPLRTTAPELIHHMRQDKKMTAGTLPFILSRGIGQAFVAKDVALPDVESFLADQLAG